MQNVRVLNQNEARMNIKIEQSKQKKIFDKKDNR